jgi:hypothetical protein
MAATDYDRYSVLWYCGILDKKALILYLKLSVNNCIT